MCGRFTVAVPGAALQAEFDLRGTPLVDFRPRYNVAPTQDAPVLLRAEDGGLRLAQFRWGLVPVWAKGVEVGNRLINARAETAAEKPAFRHAFQRRRCLVPADGWFEWKAEGKQKTPMRIHLRSGRPFALAGLWEHWARGDHELYSFTILTTSAAPGIRHIHERMPVLLPPGARERWVDPDAEPAELERLLAPYEGDDLASYAVSPLVNSPRNDVPEVIYPAVAPDDEPPDDEPPDDAGPTYVQESLL